MHRSSSACFHTVWLDNENRLQLSVIWRERHRVRDPVMRTRAFLFSDNLVLDGSQAGKSLFADAPEIHLPSSNFFDPSRVDDRPAGPRFVRLCDFLFCRFVWLHLSKCNEVGDRCQQYQCGTDSFTAVCDVKIESEVPLTFTSRAPRDCSSATRTRYSAQSRQRGAVRAHVHFFSSFFSCCPT